MEEQSAKRGRFFQFGLRTYFAAATLIALTAGLFWPRVGPPLEGCVDSGEQFVWIAPPSRAEVIAECKRQHPDLVLPGDPPIIIEKVFEETDRCSIFNFSGRRFLHRVRFRCEIYMNREFPPHSTVIMMQSDHYHLNGGGGTFVEPE